MPSVGLACGPTGGHLLPAVLIGRALKNHGIRPKLFTTTGELPDTLIDEDTPLTDLTVKPWTGQSVISKFRSILSVGLEYFRLRNRFHKLDAVVSFGGYTAMPVMIAAREGSIPIFIQEQNTIMGRTNRLFEDYALTVFYGFPPHEKSIDSDRTRVLGNPVRPAETPDDQWFRHDPLLVVMGGSQGSREVSEYLIDCAPELLNTGWHIYYLKGNYGRDLSTRGWSNTGQFRQAIFDDNLQAVLPSANCLWSRAGAGTLAELIAYELPGILFPYKHSAENHQLRNAEWVSSVGPAEVFDRNEDTVKDLVNRTRNFKNKSDCYSVPWKHDELPQKNIAEVIKRRL